MKLPKKYLPLLKNKWLRVFILTAVLIFTFILRAHNYDREPELGQLEEMLYGWAGINMLAEGVPISWSTLEYPKSAVVFEGEASLDGSNPKHFVTLVKPWLDEPPIYSLISGGAAYFLGADRWSILPSAYLRLPQIFISFFISIFVFLIARRVSGFWMGILALLLYSTIPTLVFSSRLAVPENLIALIYMILIYSVLKLRQKSSLFLILILPILIAIAGLSKPTGFLIAPLLIYEFFLKKYYKSIIYTVIIVALGVAAFIGYGAYYDSGVFWTIVSEQSTRPIGFGALGYTLATPAYDIFLFYDTLYIFCLISFAYFVFKPFNEKEEKTEHNFLIFAGVYWVIVIILSGGERDLLPWYRFGLFPLLPIFGAWIIKSSFEKISFVKSVFLTSFFLGNNYLLINPFRPGIGSMEFRAIFSALVLPSLAFEAFKKKYLKIAAQTILVLALIMGIYWNAIYIYNAHELRCERRECAIGPSTVISRLHFPILWRLFVLPPSQISNPKGFHFGRQYD